MSFIETPEFGHKAQPKEPLVELVIRIRNGEFTKEELKLRVNERIAPLLTIGGLIESSFDLGNVHWDGDILRLGDGTTR
ncbi:MAG TPA: hypothetical protein VKC54_04460 [Patescibacteria group bacterium]|nr:hypothetical protein [Patescibacteria group bacterium]